MAEPAVSPLPLEQQVLHQIRELVREVGSGRAVAAVAPGADLDRDLGLGSLERVELLVRLEEACRRELNDAAVVRARTVQDLVRAVAQAAPMGVTRGEPAPCAEPRSAEPAPSGSRAATAETLLELLELRAAESPDAVHVWLREEEGTEAAITYRDLLRGAARIAGGLRGRGLPPAAPVGLIFPTSRDFFECFFGVLLAGGVPVPLYPPHRLDEIEEYAARQARILGNAEARLLLATHEAQGLARLLQARVGSLLAACEPDEVRAPREWTGGLRVRSEDLAFLQYTSGSTGSPKGVALTHANLMANLRAIRDGVAITPADVVVTWLPLYHDMGLIGTWLGALYAGIPTHVSPPMSFLTRPQRWLWAIHQHRATITAAPNFAYDLCARKLPERALEGLDLSCWRVALNGAEAISPETLQLFCARFGRYGFRAETMFPAYGLAENAVALTFPPVGRAPRIDAVDRGALVEEGKARPAQVGEAKPARFVGVGGPVAGSEVRIVSPAAEVLPERVVGRIQFRGDSAAPGYYRNAEATAELVRADGWHETGDLGYWADGELFVTGRSKDLIIKAGRNLVPQEIEEIAGAVEGVRTGSVAAFAAPGTEGTELLVVVVETRAAGEEERARIVGAIHERVISVLGVAPDEVVLAAAGSVPKTSSGKIRRSACRDLHLNGALRAPRQRPRWRFLLRSAWERVGFRTRRAFRRAAESAYGVYAIAVVYAAVLAAWLIVRPIRPGPRASARIRRAARLALAAMGLTPRVAGLEHLAEARPRVLVSNHTSYLDVIVLYAVLPGQPRAIAKSELLEGWLAPGLLAKTGALTVRREDVQGSVADGARIEERLAAGDTVLFFPEGTFTSRTGVRPFKLGAFKSAVSAGAEVVPIALRGVRQVLRDRTKLPRPGRIEVRIGPPLRSETTDWHGIVRLRDRCREWIAAECGEPALDLVRAGLPLEAGE